jgi:hypothetical protein
VSGYQFLNKERLKVFTVMEIQVLLFWVLTPCDDVVKLTLKTEEARSSDTLLPHRKT